MAKGKRKSFKGIDAIIGDSSRGLSEEEDFRDQPSERVVDEPRNIDVARSSRGRGERIQYPDSPKTRTSILMRVDILDQLRAVSYLERRSMTKLIHEALLNYFEGKGEEYVNHAIAEWEAGQ